MKKTLYSWFMLITLLMPNACETSDPASLPRRPISIFGSSTSDTALHVLPPANVTSASLPLQIDSMRARGYPGSDIVIEQVLDPGLITAVTMFPISLRD